MPSSGTDAYWRGYSKLSYPSFHFSCIFFVLYSAHLRVAGSLIMPISAVFKEKWTKCGNETCLKVTLSFYTLLSDNTLSACFYSKRNLQFIVTVFFNFKSTSLSEAVRFNVSFYCNFRSSSLHAVFTFFIIHWKTSINHDNKCLFSL